MSKWKDRAGCVSHDTSYDYLKMYTYKLTFILELERSDIQCKWQITGAPINISYLWSHGSCQVNKYVI